MILLITWLLSNQCAVILERVLKLAIKKITLQPISQSTLEAVHVSGIAGWSFENRVQTLSLRFPAKFVACSPLAAIGWLAACYRGNVSLLITCTGNWSPSLLATCTEQLNVLDLIPLSGQSLFADHTRPYHLITA